MKKWTSLSSTPEDARWKLLSEVLREKGAQNEYSPFPGDPTAKIESMDVFAGYVHIRLSSRIAPLLMKHLKVQSSWTTLLGVVDGMNQTPHGWWPFCALYESFGQIIIQLGQDLDVRGSVLVAGSGGAARTAIAAFFKAGFVKFLITNFEENEAQQLIRELKSRFFGASFQWVPTERIVLLPGESSVIVNSTPSVEENALLRELSYLNFLKRPGVLFDLSRSPTANLLAAEAKDIGVRTISGFEIAARMDALWAKWGFQVDIDRETYQERLRAALGIVGSSRL